MSYIIVGMDKGQTPKEAIRGLSECFKSIAARQVSFNLVQAPSKGPYDIAAVLPSIPINRSISSNRRRDAETPTLLYI